MASRAEEALKQSSSATRATTSQLQQAGWQEAEADHPCIICLGEINNTAYVDGCFHTFCFDCIQQWAARRPACPLCRSRFGRILHMVRGDDDYQDRATCPEGLQSRVPWTEAMLTALSLLGPPASTSAPKWPLSSSSHSPLSLSLTTLQQQPRSSSPKPHGYGWEA
uniref:RING-type E3 ubiquitin transferase n=1 Tax=Buteo japonicus TaxID=224669 RepID=A0A8C0AN43_9AVES